MIFIVTSENRGLFDSDLHAMHRHRKAAFIDGLGWNIPACADEEIDQYDGERAIYLIAKQDGLSEVLASARLLPTSAPHLLGDLFAHACWKRAPSGPQVWEASRFCASPSIASPRRVRLLLEIICGIIETALLFGVSGVTLTANRALLPIVLRCGWSAAVLGPTLPDGKDEITAVEAAITIEGLARVRARLRLKRPVTRLIEAPFRIAA